MAIRQENPFPIQNWELAQVKEMRAIVERDKLNGFARCAFDILFPDAIPPKPFDIRHIETLPSVEYSPSERLIVNEALRGFGYRKLRSGERSAIDIPHLRIKFTNEPTAFVTRLNDLPSMHRLSNIGQTSTDIHPKGVDGSLAKLNRAEHSKQVGQKVFRDLVRMAMKTPDEFIERVKVDMQRLGFGDGNSIPHFLDCQSYDNQYGVAPFAFEGSQKKALYLALEYAKYLVTFAYIHDERTPGWGDIPMKTRARFPGQKAVEYSEDAELGERIEDMLNDKQTRLPQLFKDFQMDKEFMTVLVRRLVSEGDTTLGAQLMKSKRKKGAYTAPNEQMRQLEGIADADKDQISGTEANGGDLMERILPGGFRYSSKGDEHYPIGSFHDRLMLFTYALATGMSKEALSKALRERGIYPEDVFILAEEFHVGPSFSLTRIPQLGGEIMKVAHKPGVLKRLEHLFNVLTYFYYQSDARSGAELLVQDVAAVLNFQHAPSPASKFIDVFLERGDDGVSSVLGTVSPLIPELLEMMPSRMRRLSTNEVIGLLESEGIKNGSQHVLLSPARIFAAARKNGNLAFDDEGHIRFFEDIVRVKRGGGVNPHSIPQLIDNMEGFIKENGGTFYHCALLSQDDIARMKHFLARGKDKAAQDAVTLALRYWMMPVELGEGYLFINPLAGQFLLEGEEAPYETIKDKEDRYLWDSLMRHPNLLNLVSAQFQQCPRFG